MANVNNAAKNQKPNWFKRFLGFFKKAGLKIGKAFKNSFYELKKVTWPSKRELLNYSLITLAFMVFMGVIIYLIDLGSSLLVDLMLSIG